MPNVRKKPNRRPRRRRTRPGVKNNQKITKGVTLIKNSSVGGFPKSVFTRLKYVYNGSLNPGVAGINAVQVFRANSVYDPDFSGSGNQPRGFDQWMTLYHHYYVKRSKIIVEFHNGDATYEVSAGIALRGESGTDAVALEYQEQDAKSVLLGRVGSSNNHRKLIKYFDYKKHNFAKYTGAENKGTTTTNPSEETFYHVFVGSPWGNDPANTYYTATIYYDVLFTELKDIVQS